jgi:DNA-binding transcriptional LysR family regulator
MESYLKSHNYTSKKKIELTSNEALKQAVTAGLGLSIMPLIGIKNSLNDNELQIIPVSDLPIVTHWNLVWLKSKKLSPTALAFLDYLREEKDKIIHETFDWFEKY